MIKSLKLLLVAVFVCLSSASIFGQTGTVVGVITDKSNGETLPGANVLVKGTTLGTITDLNGKFTLMNVPVGEISLMASYIGYVSNTGKITVVSEGTVTIDFVLNPEQTELSEVVVVGYGTMKKSDKTGAVTNITSAELNGGVLTDPIQGLQGKAAGVSITKKGGDPNGGFSVKIRGSAGLFSNTNPLYVVDGVPGVDPTTIASEDIESFNVLKDASSTAIYGARGANGIVIITTKKGRVKSANIVEVSSYISIDKVAKSLDMLSGDDLRALVAANPSRYKSFVDGGANTNWQDEIYRQGLSQSYSFAASGGSETSTYRFSVTNSGFDGVIKGTSKDRTVARINLSQKALNNKLTIQSSLAATFEKNKYIQYSGSGSNDVIYQALQRNPTDPVYDASGKFYEISRDFNYYNPLALIDQIQNQRDAKRYLANITADFEIVKGLTLGTNIGYTRDDNQSFYFEPSYVRMSTSTGYASRSYGNTETKLIETTLKYDVSLNDAHNMNFVLGYSFQEDIYDGLSAQGRKATSGYVESNDIGALLDVIPGDINSYKGSNRLISFFGRGVYNFRSKYYLTATVRRDGSSRFGDNKEWGFFPSASAAWNIQAEDFMKNVSFVNQLKLRAGFGLSGNQEIGNYNDIKTVYASGTTINVETGASGIRYSASHNANPDLKWEENREYNIGIDFGVMNSKVSGSIEYYNKTTYDLIAPYAVPQPPNIEKTTWANAGEIANKGFEFNVQIYAMDKSNFDWKTNFIFSTNKQKVVSLSSADYKWQESDKKKGYLSGRGLVGDENWTQFLEEGYELGTFYMPEYAGISSDGKFLFYTAAGGVTREISEAQRRVVGHALPKFELGWSNYLTIYKHFDASFSFRMVYGFDVLNVTRMVFANPTVMPSLNGLSEVTDMLAKGITDAPKVNSYYLEDGTFIRLDNLTIGYTPDISKQKWISKLRVYFTSNNLFLITKYKGLDPEISYDGLEFGLDQYNTYPKTRTFTFGLQLTF